MFDRLAAGYDQTGVPYYAVIARGLVDRLHVRRGERVLDIGAGRGAATFPLAEAVGEGGYVDAIDVAPGMVEHLARDTAGLPEVHVELGDALTRGRRGRRTTSSRRPSWCSSCRTR